MSGLPGRHCMCVCMYVCMYISLCVCMPRYACIYVYVSVWGSSVCAILSMRDLLGWHYMQCIHKRICMCACTYVCVWVCIIHTRSYIYIYIYIYIQTYIHIRIYHDIYVYIYIHTYNTLPNAFVQCHPYAHKTHTPLQAHFWCSVKGLISSPYPCALLWCAVQVIVLKRTPDVWM